MASNGGCGGCGGADRPDAQSMQMDDAMEDVDGKQAASLLLGLVKMNTRPSLEETVAVQKEAQTLMTSGLLSGIDAKVAAAIAAAITMAVDSMASDELKKMTVDSIASNELNKLPEKLPKFGLQNVVGVVEKFFVNQVRVNTYCINAGVKQGEGDPVTPSVARSLSAIATMFAALEKLGVVQANDVIEGNALGMHETYDILNMPFWTQLLKTACGEGRNNVFVFAVSSTLYGILKILGYTPDVNSEQRQNARGMAQGISKQYNAMLAQRFVHDLLQEKGNFSRLTSKREQTGEAGAKRSMEYKKKIPDADVSRSCLRQRRLAAEKRQKLNDDGGDSKSKET
jgi:hypothetical protein